MKAPAPRPARNGDVDAFLEKARGVAERRARGRLIFALDATMSRQPTWDLAQSIQGEMFRTTAAQGGLDVQLVYFRGFRECRASGFVSQGEGLGALMSRISCQAGHTQIGRVLSHALDETRSERVGALVYIGDAMEEKIDHLAAAAGQMGLLGLKTFMFQEGQDAKTRTAFQEIARLSGGAYAAFDLSAPRRLAELFGAAAAYAVGGLPELEKRAGEGEGAARLLLSQMGSR
ncbi:VWA domain-containing protein [Methylocystis sp. JR02]|uniref:VWA domain-containing protein n=1 Tax=Methylocystis sp. JR02 TaxID=3046284 RepID=UPI0024B99CE8|nr:VWA domain-containing protein [Methylocystis sp. JR02]MDJ0447995.1 VWA domain-containing protein [Methylocystis sp. JR02]